VRVVPDRSESHKASEKEEIPCRSEKLLDIINEPRQILFFMLNVLHRVCVMLFAPLFQILILRSSGEALFTLLRQATRGTKKNRVSFLTFLGEELSPVWFDSEIYVKATELEKLRAVLWRLYTVNMEEMP
jgi:hypothetical protein